MSEPSWLEVRLAVVGLTSWITVNFPQESINEIPEPHITLLYGCNPDPAVYKGLFTDVTFNPSFNRVRTGDVSPVMLVGIKDSEISRLFNVLYNDDRYNTEHKHTLINGEYDPHMTLFWMNADKTLLRNEAYTGPRPTVEGIYLMPAGVKLM